MAVDVDKIIKVGSAIFSGAKEALKDDGVKKVVFGTYSDGSPRNFADAQNGEFLSPEQKKKMSKKKKKKKNKKFRL